MNFNVIRDGCYEGNTSVMSGGGGSISGILLALTPIFLGKCGRREESDSRGVKKL